MRSTSVRASFLAFAALAAGLALAACGGESDSYGSRPPDYERALAGAPPALAALYEQPNKLLPGGLAAFERRIEGLRGFPVVVNIWASWCGPCRAEFPTLQKASATYGKRVAFLGIDSQDSDDAAKTFLGEFPLPYPSYTDPDQEIAASLNAALGLPDTVFYDRGGEVAYLKQGPYLEGADLLADIKHYALGGG